jgi:hypothetical protein
VAVHSHVQASFENLVLLDLLRVDVRWWRYAFRRQYELHLDVLATGLGGRPL